MAWFFQTEYKDNDQGTYYSPDMSAIPEEEERFKAMGTALANEIEAKWMATGATPAERNRNSPDYPFFGSGEYPRLMHGWRYPLFEEPLRDQLMKPAGPLVDIIGSNFGTYALSQKVIDIIESIEPGIHRYLPFELRQPDGSIHPDKRWLLNICTRAEVIDTDRSNVGWLKPPSERWFGDLEGKKHLILKETDVAGRALWCEWRYHTSPNAFASDQLWNALHDAGIRGWGAHFSHPHHMAEA